MSSPAITTIIKMVESLPDELQEQIVEHVRAYLAEIEEEKHWNDSLEQSYLRGLAELIYEQCNTIK